MRLRRYFLLTVPVLAWTATPAQAQLMITPYLAANVAGDVEQGKGGPGVSVSFLGGRLGFEFDLMRYQHFFKDSEVFPADPAAPPNCLPASGANRIPCTDINTDALSYMGNLLVPVRLQRAPKLRLYGIAGLGVIRAWTNEPDRNQNNLGLNGGAGLMYSLSKRIGVRGDVRYFHALVNEGARDGVLFRDYNFLRVSAGVTFEFPR